MKSWLKNDKMSRALYLDLNRFTTPQGSVWFDKVLTIGVRGGAMFFLSQQTMFFIFKTKQEFPPFWTHFLTCLVRTNFFSCIICWTNLKKNSPHPTALQWSSPNSTLHHRSRVGHSSLYLWLHTYWTLLGQYSGSDRCMPLSPSLWLSSNPLLCYPVCGWPVWPLVCGWPLGYMVAGWGLWLKPGQVDWPCTYSVAWPHATNYLHTDSWSPAD